MLGKLLHDYTNMQSPSVGLLGAARLLATQPCKQVFLCSGNLVASSVSRGTFCLFTHQMQPSRCCRSHKLLKDQLATSKKPFSLNSTGRHDHHPHHHITFSSNSPASSSQHGPFPTTVSSLAASRFVSPGSATQERKNNKKRSDHSQQSLPKGDAALKPGCVTKYDTINILDCLSDHLKRAESER